MEYAERRDLSGEVMLDSSPSKATIFPRDIISEVWRSVVILEENPAQTRRLITLFKSQ